MENHQTPNPGIHLPKLELIYFGRQRGKTSRNSPVQTLFIILIFFSLYIQLLKMSAWKRVFIPLPRLLDINNSYVCFPFILLPLTWYACCLSCTADQSFGMWPKIEQPSLKKASPEAHSRKYKEDTFFFHYIKTWIVHLQTNNHSFPWQNKYTWRYQAEHSQNNWRFFSLLNICQQAGLLNKINFLDRMISAFEKMYSVNKTE